MLPRSFRAIYTHRCLRRSYTTSISTDTSPSKAYFQKYKKVTAFPFLVDPWCAQALMDTAAGVINSKFIPDRVKMRIYRYWEDSEDDKPFFRLYGKYLESRSNKHPLRVKAIYHPRWIVNTRFAGKVLQQNGEITPLQSALEDVDWAGAIEPPALAVEKMPKTMRQCKNTSSLAECLDPFGLEVKCLPFSISPFAQIELAKSFKDHESRVTYHGNIMLPQSLDVRFFTASPVYFPFYASEYTCPAMKGQREYTYTLYCHAFKYPQLVGIYPRLLPLLLNLGIPDLPLLDMSEIPTYQILKRLSTFPALRTDDDPCIRRTSEEEFEPIKRFMDIKNETEEKFQQGVAIEDIQTWPRNARMAYLEKYVEEKNRVNAYTPSWWYQSTLCKEGAPVVEKKERPLRSRSSPIIIPQAAPTEHTKTTKKAKKKPAQGARPT